MINVGSNACHEVAVQKKISGRRPGLDSDASPTSLLRKKTHRLLSPITVNARSRSESVPFGNQQGVASEAISRR